jgi:hypothetical protein
MDKVQVLELPTLPWVEEEGLTGVTQHLVLVGQGVVEQVHRLTSMTLVPLFLRWAQMEVAWVPAARDSMVAMAMAPLIEVT